MKQGLKRAMMRLVTAIGLPQAILPKVIKETRIVLRQDAERESGRLARWLEKSLARHAKQVDQTLADKLRGIREQIRAYDDRLGALKGQVEAGQRQLARFERQAEVRQLQIDRFEALLVQDEAPDPGELAQLNLRRITEHAERQLESVSISAHPFAHLIVDDLLPADFYELLVEAIPPKVFFAREKKSKHDFRPNARLAPQRTKAIWGFMDQQVCPRALMPILLERFAPLLDEHYRTLFGEAALDQARALPMTTFDGRIMRRRPGYSLGPHQDPMRYFLTGLLYLPSSSGEDVRWGTQLFATDQEFSIPFSSIFYPESHGVRCALAKTAPYRRNSILVFLNHRSLHGAEIPPEEAPEDLERFAFQFYIGPESAALEALVQSLPDERREAWRSRRAAASLVNAG